MRIALVSPRSPSLGRSPEFKAFFARSPEMEFYRQYWSGLGSGLLVVAALTPPHIDLTLIDENAEEINFGGGYDLVAITAMTQQAPRAYEIADRFRARNIAVVMGGIHATVLPDEARRHADSVVVGEAENSWGDLLADFAGNRLRPVYAAEREVDLKASPVPRYSLLQGKPHRIVWVQTSRGCPHDCGFCCASRVYGSTYRHKGVGQVVAEIQAACQVLKNPLIGFADDNLLSNRRFARELLGAVRGLRVKWIGQSDISVARDETLLDLVKSSGCVALLIGLESVNEENLRGLDSSNWKQQQLQHYEKSISAIQGKGIGIIGAFMIGFDHDDQSIFDRTAQFIIDNHLAGAQIAALTPFPNTRLREELSKAGRVLDTSWSNYTLYDVNIKPARMSCEQLGSGIIEVFKRVYSPEVAAAKRRYFREVFSSRHRSP